MSGHAILPTLPGRFPMSAPESAPGFASLGLRAELVEALTELGYEEPTPVQRQALPPLLEGRDVLGQAATGTGKTAAFALPLLHRLEPGVLGPFETSALILVPTRELAIQVAEAVHSYGRKLGISVLPVYGGQEIGQQLRRLKRGIDVVIATPGRTLDHLRRKSLKLGKVRTVVLDEADEMLDLGFAEDLEAILDELPEQRQSALFSATLSPRISAIAERLLDKPVRIRIAGEKARAGSLPRIDQIAYLVPRGMKAAALGRILDVEGPRSAIVFCRTRIEVEQLNETLTGHGYSTAALHGGMDQAQRDRTLRRFKAHQLELLVATDVAARGLDVENLSHVINFDLPTAPEAYVHRIGRTGRAGKTGRALTLLEPREQRLLRNIERLTGQPIALEQLPTLVDLRARRLELTRATVQEALAREDLAPYRALVERLASEAELQEVAAAAIATLHEQLHPTQPGAEEEEIPHVALKAAPERKAPKPGARQRAEQRTLSRVTRLFVGIGRSSGLRPGDLVGAIANETGIDAGAIGAIQITDRHSFVEIAEEHADQVMEALRGSTLRGRKVRVDLDRRGAPGGSKE
jgi:ATP-dependent RNA helicase DeaD